MENLDLIETLNQKYEEYIKKTIELNEKRLELSEKNERITADVLVRDQHIAILELENKKLEDELNELKR